MNDKIQQYALNAAIAASMNLNENVKEIPKGAYIVLEVRDEYGEIIAQTSCVCGE